jgi:hypothetical protein
LTQIVGRNTGLSDTHHSVADLEDALWGNNYVVPYKLAGGISLVTFTFPTKLAYNGAKDGQYDFGLSTAKDAIGAGVAGGADVIVSATAFDNSENNRAAMFNVSPLPVSATLRAPEFGWLFVGCDATTKGLCLDVGNYTEGWLNVVYPNATNATAARATQQNGNLAVNAGRKGIPGIVTVMNKQANAFTWSYAASAR